VAVVVDDESAVVEAGENLLANCFGILAVGEDFVDRQRAGNSGGVADEQRWFYRYRYCCYRFTVFSVRNRVSSAEKVHCSK
jgi:hypothetical protein